VLALAAGTEAGRIVAEAGGEVVAADDPGAIELALRSVVADQLAPPDAELQRVYAYPAIAERMEDAVTAAIEARRASK
jgi:hypothetical protein